MGPPELFPYRSTESSESALLLRGESPSNKTIPRGIESLLLQSLVLQLGKMSEIEGIGSEMYILVVVSGFGKTVTEEKAILAIDEHASFVVDDFVDAKESS